MKLKVFIVSSSLLFTSCTGKDTIQIGDSQTGTSMECNKIVALGGAVTGGTIATVVVDKAFGSVSKPLKLFLSGLGVVMGGAFACILGQKDKENIKGFIETAKEGDATAWENEDRNNLRVAIKALDIEEKKDSNGYTNRVIRYQIRSEIEKNKFTQEVVTSKLRLKS